MKISNEFIRGYIESAFAFTWLPSEESYLEDVAVVQDLSKETCDQMLKDCLEFRTNHDAILTEAYRTIPGYSEEGAGADFWVIRNGLADGFDEEPSLRSSLSSLEDAASAYGEFVLYLGDDGKIYHI
jgi:hypothetical protein